MKGKTFKQDLLITEYFQTLYYCSKLLILEQVFRYVFRDIVRTKL